MRRLTFISMKRGDVFGRHQSVLIPKPMNPVFHSPTKSPRKKVLRFGSDIDSNLPIDTEDILMHCGTNVEEIENYGTNEEVILNSALFYAFLCQISKFAESVIVISPEFTEILRENEKNGEEEIAIDGHFFGDRNIFDIAIIPIKNSNYYSIGFYQKNASIQYYDTMHNGITIENRSLLRKTVSALINFSTIVRVYQAKNALFNKAETTELTMLHCCVIARLYIFNERKTYVEEFSAQTERIFIANVLQKINIEDNPFMAVEDDEINESYKQWRQRRNRELETTDESEERKSQHRERMRISREEISDDELEERRIQNRERMRLSRREETLLETDLRQSESRNRYRNKIKKLKKSTILFAREFNDNIPMHQLNPMNVICAFCGVLHFAEEATTRMKNSFNECCRHGKVSFPALPEPPEMLRELFSAFHEKSTHFFQNIRRINCALSFASINPIPERYVGRTRGPTCVKVHGKVTFLVNKALLADAAEQASYTQLYLIDTREARNIRSQLNPTVDSDLLEELGQLIKENNELAMSFMMMKEELEVQKERAVEEGVEIPELRLIFTGDTRKQNLNTYNIPRSNEIAVIYEPGADNNIPETLLMVHPIGKELEIMKSTNQLVDPMIYPLFFPYGTFGWHDKIYQENNPSKRITRAEYASYRIFTRNEDYNVIQRGRELFQQFCAEYSIRILKDRLDYIKFNQKKMMADLYVNVKKRMENEAQATGKPIGKKIILPSSVTGTPRWETEQFQDAMTMLMEIGRPDLFITFTCNPNWPEIKDNIFDGQSASDRPDIVSRVFDLKKNALLKEIVEDGVLGNVRSYLYVIEWQQRGLPHQHMLITLEDEHKLRTGNEVDTVIQAQLPDESTNPNLFKRVTDHHLHGPHKFGADGNIQSGCYKPDKRTGKMKCRFNYPKDFNEKTTLDENGYPNYARPDNGRVVDKNGIHLDNRWVAPYNPYLLLKYNAHINVERVFDIRSIKYMYKYIYKGPDRAEIELQNDEASITHDEVKRYIDGRYVGAPEGCWHILRKEVQKKSHTIIRLPIHLEGQQSILFSENATEEEIEDEIEKKKMLIDYFELNKRDGEAKQYYYREIPRYYVWQKQIWKKRKQHFNTLGRVRHVSPTEGDCFYLRILLCHVKGATSFDELYEFDNHKFSNYKEVCLARELIRDDKEWFSAMEEAEIIMTAKQMRVLFARILVHCDPVDPIILWERFKGSLAEDYLNQDQNTGLMKTYISLAQSAIEEGKQLKDILKLPEYENIDLTQNEIIDRDQEMIEATENYAMLNDDQKKIIDNILAKMGLPLLPEIEEISNIIFIDGPGGTGKTTLYKFDTQYQIYFYKQKFRVLYRFFVAHGISVYNTAFTGIAAILLPKGRTLHNRFGLPAPLYSDSNSNIGPGQANWQELFEADAFIIDEASMIPKHALRVIDDLLRHITQRPDLLFGGKIFIMGGDFRQTLPIQKNATKSQQLDLSIKRCSFWKEVTCFKLTKNMRAKEEEQEFAEWILRVGNGEENDEEEHIQIPKQCICKGNLSEEIFSVPIASEDWDSVCNRAILAPLNVEVDSINNEVLEMIPGESKIYKSIDSAKKSDNSDADPNIFPLEFLQSLRPQGFPPHELCLKKFAVVMLIRNLNIKNGLSNGTRLRVMGLHRNVIECQIIGGDRDGETEFIPRITLNNTDEYPFTLSRHQFPLRLAFSFTIIKSQGQTLQKVGIDLRTDVFSHGQLYVALSRGRSLDGIKIILPPGKDKAKNIVYKEILE